MKKVMLVAASAGLVAALVVPAMASAAPPHLGQNWGSYVNASACAGGTLVINVTLGDSNVPDSGQAGNSWAYDDYQKLVQVWDEGGGTFCAVVHYLGQFTTVAGQESPGMTVPSLAGGFTGFYAGGYQATLTGTLNTNPTYPASGNLGSFVYPPGFDWPSVYFSALSSFTYDAWGWVYQGGACGTWYNTSFGNSGDIVC